MSSDKGLEAEKIRHLLETEGSSISANTQIFNDGRYDAIEELENYEELKDQATLIKEDVIDRLPQLIDTVTAAVEQNGGEVYFAEDAADARSHVQRIIADRGTETVVKSKSMTTEEIELNDHLAFHGVDVWETDMGEFILQLAEDSPSHLVAPAIHWTREEIADLFNERLDPDSPLQTASELTAFARSFLGKRIESAQVGITGANFIAADTGTMVLITSEGNARKCIAQTDTHITVAGIEKLVPTVEQLQPFIELIGRSATGQSITSYVSMLTPPIDAPNYQDGRVSPNQDRSFHLVLLDNGRLEMRDDTHLRETLRCIRCSACLNSCANFQQVGGHAFGGETYSGGIGTGWEAGIHGLEAADFNELCTGCSRCVNQCPVRIDIPWINTVVRERINRGYEPSKFDHLVDGLIPNEEPGSSPASNHFIGNFDRLAKFGSMLTPLSNHTTKIPGVRSLMERFIDIDKRRPLPTFNSKSLTSWARDRKTTIPADPTKQVVLYPDSYSNYVHVNRGKAAVCTLEALNVEVIVPNLPPSGRAPLSQGMITTAEKQAKEVFNGIEPHLSAGYDLVVIEPSDLAMFRRDYERFLSPKEFELISDSSYELFEYIHGLLEFGAEVSNLDSNGLNVAFHSHCQQRTLGLENYTQAVLTELGCDVVTSTSECCGMAGSFGYKSEYYELSMAVGRELAAEFNQPDYRNRIVLASGASCYDQLNDLLERPIRYPIEILEPHN